MPSIQMNSARSSLERARRAYRAKVRELVAETFGLSNAEMRKEDEIWERWLARVEKEWELYPFLHSGVKVEPQPLHHLLHSYLLKDSFKARVLAVFCAPTLSWAPFRYPTRDPAWNYVSEWFTQPRYSANGTKPLVNVIGDLSGKLQRFFWTLLEINLDAIDWNKPRKVEHPLPIVSDRNVSYNRLVLWALTVLPVDSQTERFLQLYHTNPSGNWLGLWLPGASYSPFREMLRARVPEQWKEQIDVLWRRSVTEQKEGTGQFMFRDWEAALQRYATEAQAALEGDGHAVSVHLFASQVNWILEVIEGTALRPFRYDSWNYVLNILRDDKYQFVYYRFVRHMALAGDAEHPFRVTGDIDWPLVKRALAMFGDADPELAVKLRAVLTEHAARVAKRNEEASQMQAAVAAMY